MESVPGTSGQVERSSSLRHHTDLQGYKAIAREKVLAHHLLRRLHALLLHQFDSKLGLCRSDGCLVDPLAHEGDLLVC